MPIFEGGDDRAAEVAAAKMFEQAQDCEIRFTPTLSAVDWLMFSDRLTGIAEFKCRQRRYDTIVLDKQKADDLILLSRVLQVPAGFVVWFPNESLLAAVKVQPVRHQWSMRKFSLNEPREQNDIDDLVYDIPWSDFRVING